MACGSYSTGTAQIAQAANFDKSGDWRTWAGREYYNEVETPATAVQPLVDDSVVCVGTPDDCIRVIKHWEEIGVDQIMLIMQAGRMPHDVIKESIENFGKYVLPEFQKSPSLSVR
jgi:alkanesulfonate monooxygenase SsuD/methylene tetrahydromethanopterin reductase-like flavin-dependent oxidoreductase (luciferase family)